MTDRRPPRPRTLVEVALPLPVDHTFTYAVPGDRHPVPGTRVLVPFRETERIGWVVGPTTTTDARSIRPVLDVLEAVPSAPPELLDLARWVADYYVTPLGMTLKTMLPSVLADASRDYVALTGQPAPFLRPREVRLVAALKEAGGSGRVRTLRKRLGMGSLWPEIRRMKESGVLTHVTVPPQAPSVRVRKVVRLERWLSSLADREEIFARAPRQRELYETLEAAGGAMELAELGRRGFARAVVAGLEKKSVARVESEEVSRDPFAGTPEPSRPDLTPNPHQAAALEALRGALDDPDRRPFLLHGVTGSGKTLVYIELLRDVVERRGRSAIVLVPEISLTPQTVARFRAWFGDRVAVLHSALSDGERYDAWRELREGHKRIAVGARSAVFAPLEDLGAVIVDEEHDGSYKQGEAPRYNARDLAVVRALRAGAVCVLGSATPSLESWHNGTTGKFSILTLPLRATGTDLPPVRVIDLRHAPTGSSPGGGAPEGGEAGLILSADLVEAIRVRLERREQVILLLNRRGYANFIQCRECGDVRSCVSCSISLTYHRVTHRLVCHHCRYEEPAPTRCQRCGSKELSYRGLGTEQVERAVARAFPGARIARMDVDTTSGKWSHHEILGRVERGEVDILLGTQMIAKGLDFPGVTLVGVVNADVGIHLPDFRASERTFQLLSQVAGRAGRGPGGGEVLIQTRIPDHYAIRATLTHDYAGFAEREVRERAGPGYPPHQRLVNVVASSPDPEAAAAAAEQGAAWARRWIRDSRMHGLDVVGPAPAPIERLHGRWRWHFLFRSPSPRDVGALAHALARDFRAAGGGDVRVVVDRDPVALL